MATRGKRDPRTKEELLNKMLSFDFNGDIRDLGAEPATVQRQGPNSLLLKFPASGAVFEVSIHRPREFAQVAKKASAPAGEERAAEERSFSQSGEERREARIEGLTDDEKEAIAAEVAAKNAPKVRARRKDAGQPRTRRERQQAAG